MLLLEEPRVTLDAGSSAIGAKTVTYTAQTGDNAQAIMRGLRDALRAADTRFSGANAQTLDADSVAGTHHRGDLNW